MLLCLDSSVFVAASLEEEAAHHDCVALLTAVASGRFDVVLPVTVPIEVACAIARRADDAAIGKDALESLLSDPNLKLLALTIRDLDRIVALGSARRLRGMDAVVAACAKAEGAALVTLDEELINRLAGVIEVKRPAEVR